MRHAVVCMFGLRHTDTFVSGVWDEMNEVWSVRDAFYNIRCYNPRRSSEKFDPPNDILVLTSISLRRRQSHIGRVIDEKIC